MPTEPGEDNPGWFGTRAAALTIWVLLAAAIVLLVLAWTYPLLTVTVGAELPEFVPPPLQSFTILDETRSVFSMMQRLEETGYYVIAALILVFAVLLPLVKNAGVAILMASSPGGRGRRWARALQFMGRFAMVDIFAVGIVVSVVAASTIGQGAQNGPAAISTVTYLESGFYLFVAYVLLSFAVDVLLALRFRRGGL